MAYNMLRLVIIALAVCVLAGCNESEYGNPDQLLTNDATLNYTGSFQKYGITQLAVHENSIWDYEDHNASVTVHGHDISVHTNDCDAGAFMVQYMPADKKGPAALVVLNTPDRARYSADDVVGCVHKSIDAVLQQVAEQKAIADSWKNDQQSNTH